MLSKSFNPAGGTNDSYGEVTRISELQDVVIGGVASPVIHQAA